LLKFNTTRVTRKVSLKFLIRLMILIGSLTSPYVRKVRIVAAEKHFELKLELEDVWKPGSRIVQLNPLGKVPTLVMEDGGAIFDSRVIVEYLDQLTPVHRLIPEKGRERIEVRCWEALADGLMDAAILARLEATQRPEAQRSADWIERQMIKVRAAVQAMARGLGTNDWCCEGKYSLADVATGCALSYLDFRFPEIALRTDNPALTRYAEKLFRRQSFIDTRPPSA
jgi:glutathione S-transferase